MAKAANIEERTELFIAEHKRLTKLSELPDNKTLAPILGINSASTLSNILGRRQNISHKAWKAFRETYGQKIIKNGSENTNWQEPTLNQVLMVLAQNVTRIEKNMAQEETQARIEASLDTIQGNQGGGFVVLFEILKRDVEREAKGNQDKVKKILGDIALRIPPIADFVAQMGK